MSSQPYPVRKDDDDKDGGLAAARKELTEMSGRPFEVDKILAGQDAKREREQEAGRAAKASLEKIYEKAREQRSEMRAQAAETEARTLRDKTAQIEHGERRLKDQLKRTPKPKEGSKP